MTVAELLLRAQAPGLYRTIVTIGAWSDAEDKAAEQAMAACGYPIASDATYNRVVICRDFRGEYVAKRETWEVWGKSQPTIGKAIAVLAS